MADLESTFGSFLAVQWLGLGVSLQEFLGLISGLGTKILQAKWSGKKKKRTKQINRKSALLWWESGQALPTATLPSTHTLVHLGDWPVTPRREAWFARCWHSYLDAWEKQKFLSWALYTLSPGNPHVDDTAGGKRRQGYTNCLLCSGHYHSVWPWETIWPFCILVFLICHSSVQSLSRYYGSLRPMNPSNPHINVNKWRITANSVEFSKCVWKAIFARLNE